jgi:hypothetical protein
MALKPVVACVIVVGVAGGLYGTFEYVNTQPSDLELQLNTMATEGNSKLPMMLDADTRLDSMTVHSEDTFEYEYTLINLQASKIDRDAFEQAMAAHLLAFVCKDNSNEVFRTNGVKVVYTYYGSEGGQVASVAIPTSGCAATGADDSVRS